MKGIVLAGGTGKRMLPLTELDNKHLLPVYNKRMIEYPIQSLLDVGVEDIILITGGNRPGTFLELFKNGRKHGIKRLYYTYQEGSGGIAHALSLAEPFIEDGEECLVILGDNYFEQGIGCILKDRFPTGARCILQETQRPWDFGIAKFEGQEIVSVEEKPQGQQTGMAILGCYLFDYTVWSMLSQVSPSARGELEITDVLKIYMEEGVLDWCEYTGFWSDMGTFESWAEVSKRVRGVT